MKPSERDRFVLSTGKEFNAFNQVIGLDPTEIGDDISIHEGSDGTVYTNYEHEYKDAEDCFTNAELIEIANYMIEQWNNVLATLKSC